MNFNKFLKKIKTPYLILTVLLIFGSLYFLTNNFKLIEGNDLRREGSDEAGAQGEAEVAYTITNEVLPDRNHVTEGRSVGLV
tara:strand:- start:1893 stop:2138 length:246 start_codon:yes stop_codon:yes gene_type:complete